MSPMPDDNSTSYSASFFINPNSYKLCKFNQDNQETMALITFLAFSLLLHGALGDLICEQLPLELCSYSIASTGKRCLLETHHARDETVKMQCKTSEVVVDAMKGHIESEECVSACGLDRNTIGISSDSLLHPRFLAKLCSPACYGSCPNILDLYSNLALGEGTYLPTICANPRRTLYQTRSSGVAAPAPFHSTTYTNAPYANSPTTSLYLGGAYSDEYPVSTAPSPI